MSILKFVKKKIKKSKKIYNLLFTDTIKTTKYNARIYLGTYNSKKNLYIFIYPNIICFSKLGSKFSNQFLLISLFYLKKLIKNNLFKKEKWQSG